MKKVIVASKNGTKDPKSFVSENLRIQDKSLEYAVRQILFDENNTIDWDKAAQILMKHMPELKNELTSVSIDLDKCYALADSIITGELELDENQQERAEDVVDFNSSSPQELGEDISTLLYVLYGLVDGEDYQVANNSILIVYPSGEPFRSQTAKIWREIAEKIGE